MKTFRLEDMYRGWFIGHFEPTAFRTEQFEVGVLRHKKDEHWPAHVHKVATEINVLLSGSMTLNGRRIAEGDIFIIEPNEPAEPVFHEDCTVLCVKTPSVAGDKYELVR